MQLCGPGSSVLLHCLVCCSLNADLQHHSIALSLEPKTVYYDGVFTDELSVGRHQHPVVAADRQLWQTQM